MAIHEEKPDAPLPLIDLTSPIGGAGNGAASPLLSTRSLLGSVLADLEARHQAQQGGGWTGGLRCGLPLLDDTLRGFRPGSITILNAPPNVGKTTLANQLAYQIASFPEQKAAALYVSFENSPEQLLLKQLSRLSGWPISDLEAGKFSPSEERLQRAVRCLASVPLFYLAGSVATTPQVIRERAGEAIREAGEGHALFVVLDYLQYFSRFFSARAATEQIGYALSSLKDIATEAEAALLVIGSQNRETNKSKGDGATMFGGRGSGEIEYDADTLLSLTREDNAPVQGGRKTTLTAVKTRFGGAGNSADLLFYEERAHFKTIAEAGR